MEAAAKLGVLTRYSSTNLMATQPEHGIAFSWRTSMLPPPLHSTSVPGEVRVCVLPSASRQHLPGSAPQLSVLG
jgi:hypothetical protein